ncbi:MAG: helix-turn-helix domain-containing protein [Thermoplasmata archaeon]|nr:helix-turn-helix domain-containing protein [Thermoplasmata archaeon]
MARTETIQIRKAVPIEFLEQEIDGLDGTSRAWNDILLKKQLELVRYRYLGMTMITATKLLRVNLQTGYNWQSAWNESGIEGLRALNAKSSPRMDAEEMRSVADAACENGMSTEDVADYIRENYGIDMSVSQVKRKLFRMGLMLESVEYLVKTPDGQAVRRIEKWKPSDRG